jgi:hypothetical protein
MNVTMTYDGKSLKLVDKNYELKVSLAAGDIATLIKQVDVALKIITEVADIKQVSILETDNNNGEKKQ